MPATPTKPVQHPGLVLKQKLADLRITPKQAAELLEIHLTTLYAVLGGKQPFPLWLCEALGNKAIGTKVGWLIRVRNYEFYCLAEKWKEVDALIDAERKAVIRKRRGSEVA